MAIIGLGGSLSVADSGVTQTPFVEVKEITLPKADLEYLDSSYLGQGDSYRRFIGSLIQPGDAAWTLHYTKADLARCYALRGVAKEYVITFPDASTVTFTAILQHAEVMLAIDQIIEIKCSARVTGLIVFVPGA